MKKLIKDYNTKRAIIRDRLKEFSKKQKENDKEIFKELCFCILTPQSKAVYCNKAIDELQKKDLLISGNVRQIRKILRQFTRFHNKKAMYLITARRAFSDSSGFSVKKRLNAGKVPEIREWLVKKIKGIGYKEASHFLRNVGMGGDIAILDRHIMENLKDLGVIGDIPKTLTRKKYLEIENKMRQFAKKIRIPLEELDLLFWSNQTGFVFK